VDQGVSNALIGTYPVTPTRAPGWVSTNLAQRVGHGRHDAHPSVDYGHSSLRHGATLESVRIETLSAGRVLVDAVTELL
jgi:hypothetical protein